MDTTKPAVKPPLPASAEPTRIKSICPECGEVFERDRDIAFCPDCKPKDDGSKDAKRGNRHQRGYDNTWSRLSARARKLQPFCLDCGSTYDLTADHNTDTWKRREAGKVLRLKDIDVVCRRCNGERGAARGETATDAWRR